jgi:peptidoglycan-associated lipoprotein
MTMSQLISFRWIGSAVVTVGLLAGLGACSSGVKLNEAGAAIEPSKGVSTDTRSGATTGTKPNDTSVVKEVTVAADPLNDPNNPLSKRSIFFDYDSFEIRSEFSAIVDAHAKYLNANKAKKVTIQGNTDERGSREYNLALGQKRAEAVRKALAALGVSESQMEAISFGEEKPRGTSNDEAAWAENRRADFAY